MANIAVAANTVSDPIATTAKNLVTVITDRAVIVSARNNATTPASWNPIARLQVGDTAAFVAPSNAIRLEAGKDPVNAEVN